MNFHEGKEVKINQFVIQGPGPAMNFHEGKEVNSCSDR